MAKLEVYGKLVHQFEIEQKPTIKVCVIIVDEIGGRNKGRSLCRFEIVNRHIDQVVPKLKVGSNYTFDCEYFSKAVGNNYYNFIEVYDVK